MIPVNHKQGSNPRIKGDASWCGDVYKANFDLKSHHYAVCLIDHGCGIIKRLKSTIEPKHHNIDFDYYARNWVQIPTQTYENIQFEM